MTDCVFLGKRSSAKAFLQIIGIKKGIITKRISILPPEEQYAQIINVSDYNLSKEVSEYETKDAKRHTAESMTQRIGE